MGKERKDRRYAPGERIPGTEYVVVRLEAQGGHGALYLVHHHFLEKKLQMLKTLRAHEPNPELIARLKREAQMLAGMHHPNIVSVVSGGITDEPDPRPYFVMERLRGHSLATILAQPSARRGVGQVAALQILTEMCDALQYIHERGVIHRDVKPDNIFLEREELSAGARTKLLDFGVVHLLSADPATDPRLTAERSFVGTLRYAAPELFFGERPTPETDLYALGLVGHELLTGKHPFEECVTMADFAKAHFERAPPRFPEGESYPEGLEALLRHMLEKKVVDRPRSAEAVGRTLRAMLRIAELSAGVAPDTDIEQTSPTPVQNALTETRAEDLPFALPPSTISTNPFAPTLPSEGAPKPVVTEESVAPVTPPDAPPHAETRAPTPAEPPVERGAPTRTLDGGDAKRRRRNDTEEEPLAGPFSGPRLREGTRYLESTDAASDRAPRAPRPSSAPLLPKRHGGKSGRVARRAGGSKTAGAPSRLRREWAVGVVGAVVAIALFTHFAHRSAARVTSGAPSGAAMDSPSASSR